METLRDVAQAADRLQRGGLIAYPTETFYGLGVFAFCPSALARLVAAKLRPSGKPFPVIVGQRDDLTGLVKFVEPIAERLVEYFWPGPLTLVLPALESSPSAITEAGTVAVRVPGSPLARTLAQLAGGPVISTSANLSGGIPPVRASDLDPLLAQHLDAVLDGGPTPGGLPSTLVAVEGGQIQLLRPGAIPWEAILAVVD